MPKSSNNINLSDNQTALEKSAIVRNFFEKRIFFLPTYKFDSGTNVYDTSKK